MLRLLTLFTIGCWALGGVLGYLSDRRGGEPICHACRQTDADAHGAPSGVQLIGCHHDE